MMVAVVNPSTSTHRVPEGIASTQFHNQHFAMPVTSNRTVSFGNDIETFEIPIEHDCNLNPCHAKQRTHNPICITKDDRYRKDTIEARESDAILAAQLSLGGCMESLANATSHATVISAAVIASFPT